MDSFNPVVACPICGYHNRPSITGWGGEVSTRRHVCKRCLSEYTVILVSSSTAEFKISSMHISAMKARIKYKLEEIRNLESKLVNRDRELAKELLRQEALANILN